MLAPALSFTHFFCATFGNYSRNLSCQHYENCNLKARVRTPLELSLFELFITTLVTDLLHDKLDHFLSFQKIFLTCSGTCIHDKCLSNN